MWPVKSCLPYSLFFRTKSSMEQKSFPFLPVPFAIAAVLGAGRQNACGLVANAVTTDQLEPSPAQIADLAHRIWEAEGRPDGREVVHWLEAEARLRAHFGHIRMLRESTAW
jgi:hypothetical protein